MENFTTKENTELWETKLVDIMEDFELDGNSTLNIEEENNDKSLILVNTKQKESDNEAINSSIKLPNWNVAPYDLGGHSPYFNSHKMFASKSSFFFLVFSKYVR